MLWLDRLLEKIPTGALQAVTIQFPDPWFKKKHIKRRMVNAELAETVARHLAPGGRIFLQTDIEFLADEMFDLFRSRVDLAGGETVENPFPVKTERETAVEGKGFGVFRAIFYRPN
jgi:tRNA (guanine-N7-)-methyltransferase